MAHDQFNTSNNWWDSSRNRYEAAPPSSSSSTINNSFGWPNEMVDIKARPSVDLASESDNSSVVFHNPQKLQGPDSTSLDLHMIDLGLSSQSMDWNQALLRGDKTETSFRSILQDNMNYQQINRGFSLDQPPPQFSGPHGSSSEQSSTVTCQGLPSLYGTSPSTMLQGLLGSDNNQQQQQQQQSSFDNHHHPSLNYQYEVPNYAMSSTATNEPVPNSWSKVPQFLRSTTSPPKQQSQLQFSNNAAFWNASSSSMTDVRPGFFPTLQPQFLTPSFDEKPKNISEDSSSVVGKKSTGESASKRPRNENSTSLPPFKVRKEKMGDRITALQQLVSPFGKTDTASVLSESIEYIKFLQEQVALLSTPYMKSGDPIHHQQQQQQQQSCDKSKDPDQGPKQDLRSRGLCLVPISSTFPVTHETEVDFWTPTFGVTFR